MSLRAKLEAKQRRRMDVPVLVSDPSADQESFLQVAAALGMARERGESVAELEQQQDEATQRVQSHWVRVPLQQIPPGDYEAAMAACATETGTDWDRALPLLLAASSIDPELQDEQWWTERFASGDWSVGDKDTLRLAVMRLNLDAADPIVPKD